MKVVKAFLLVCVIKCALGARLLGVFPNPANSHYILGLKLMKGFANAGHDVTFITPYVTQDKPAGNGSSWTDIYLEELEPNYRASFKNINMFEDNRRSAARRVISYQEMMLFWVEATLSHPKVRALLESDAKFDAVIMEQCLNDAHKYFAHHYRCPLVLLSTVGPNPWVNNVVGNPAPPSYVQHFFNDESNMNFFDRLYNLYLYTNDALVYNFYTLPLHNSMLAKHFPEAPSVEALNQHVSIILLSSHVSLSDPVPLVPNMVEIGGYHVDPPKPLPNDSLRHFLDTATAGVIYFSMGSNLKSKDMSEEKLEAIWSVFRRLKQKVLWKFEDENVTGKPDNVFIRSWLPQQDVLAHPNVHLFVTHGGLLSIIESVYHGKPILAIPVFADQFLNANKAVKHGFGLKLPYNDDNFNEENFYNLIRELIANPRYKKVARRRSEIFHDRPLSPMENAVYWLEYATRQNGAQHLMVAGASLPYYKYYMLDVVAVSLGALYFSYVCLKMVVRRLSCAKTKEKDTTSTKKSS